MDFAPVLLRTALFQDLQPGNLQELIPLIRRLEFAQGQFVWSEGDPALALYILASGQVKTFCLGSEGGEVFTGVRVAGETFGEPGLFHPRGTRGTTAQAMAPSVCLTIPKEPLLTFFTHHPPALRRMLALLSDMIWGLSQTLTDVAFLDIRSRVARTLLELAASHGEPGADGVRITMKLSQGALAGMVAATRENVNRALALFIARRDISHRDGIFIIHRRDELDAEV